MRITILNSNPDQDSPGFDRYLRNLAEKLEIEEHIVKNLTLRPQLMLGCRHA